MTTRTIYQCDGCNQEFGRLDVIKWGYDTHYCKKCAKHEAMELCNHIRTQCEHLDFDTPLGRDVLEDAYDRLRHTYIELAEYENGE